ncbi:MAG: transglutaminase-like domain-containing protein [Calditrichia bacterium]
MRDLANKGKTTLLIRNLALRLVRRNAQKDFIGEVSKIHRFVRDHIRYVKDIVGVETVQSPAKTLELGQGDCDDKVTLAGALLASIGNQVRFVAIGFIPGSYSHVLLDVRLNQKWIPIETTEPWPLGKLPPGITQRLIVYL